MDLNQNDNSSNTFYKESVKENKRIFRYSIYIIKSFFTICIFLIVGIVGGTSYALVKDVFIPKYADNTIAKVDTITDKVTATGDGNDLIKTIIRNVKPSVVSIITLNEDSSHFLPIQRTGAGSGIIFHKSLSDVFIATNYHVINGASVVSIAFGDNVPVLAKLIGKDVTSDVAVLSVPLETLHKEGIYDIAVAKFAKSENVKVGDYTIAIGNAVGEGITSTFGIISSISSSIETQGNRLNVLQTTSAINPGNSGGALVSLNGEVIGINVAKIANNKVEGVGYTISSDEVIPIIERIMNNTKPASLGVMVADLSPSNNLQIGGAIVRKVVKNSPAYKANISEKDIITSINGIPIFKASQLVDEIGKYSVSDTIKLTIVRDGRAKTIKVKLTSN